ncbi:DNA polymerase III subunit beta [Streptomyces roseofulvus]|uniref:DNA polymerase III subunit beta n=2 Tax=Streptomyces TaxID=1883 RepID=A0ABU4KCR2_9ACTN|nr:DNA polymerase III subunit beta [Streptomyces roseolus]MDX2295563.1 DNA polymerase III subunit beta [Streptomyces roseolus]
MEIHIDSAVLTEAVGRAARVLPARSPLPVLGGLLLEAGEDGRLSVFGLDHEASARVEAEAETVTPGRVLVLGRRLLDICKVLPRGRTALAVEGPRLSVSSGDVRFGLSLLPLDAHPAAPALPPVLGEVDGDAFAEAVAQVAAAAGRDDALPVLTGIRLALDGPEMTLAATDRYRYAVRTLEWYPDPAAAPAEPADVVVPARRLAETARSLAAGGRARIGLDAHSLGFERAGLRATTRLLDGRLPRHDKLFALGDHAVAVTGRAALVEAVKRVSVVAEGDSPVQLAFDGTALRLRAGYEDDVASQRLPAALDGAQEMTVAFNPGYLLDALDRFTADDVRLHLLGPGQRALLTDGDDGRHRHLLMSVKPLV